MKNTKLLQEFMKTLSENGFKVYWPVKEDCRTWFYFVKNDKIGTAQQDEFGGLDLMTVHKPCKKCGTGFSVVRNEFHPTIKQAEQCFATPREFQLYYEYVRKYENWNEFAKKEYFKMMEYIPEN